MPAFQILFAYLPLLVISGCVIQLFRRTGHSRTVTGLSAIPFILIAFSMLATMAGENMLMFGLQGSWALAGAVAVLVIRRWPIEGEER